VEVAVLGFFWERHAPAWPQGRPGARRSHGASTSEEQGMNTLVVIGYSDLYQAEEVCLKLWKLQKNYLIDLEDAVVVTKN
jgi:hypothetical protein